MNQYQIREEEGKLVARRTSDDEKLGYSLGTDESDRTSLITALTKHGWREVE